MKKISHIQKPLFVLLLLGISLLLAFLFENLEKFFYCNPLADCRFWGSFLFFFVFNTVFLFILGFFIRTFHARSKESQRWHVVLKVILPFVFLIFAIGTYKGFHTYVLATPVGLVISNDLKLTIDPAIHMGKYTLLSKDMKEVVIHWYLHTHAGGPGSSCQFMSNLVMSDGTEYSLDDYGVGGSLRSFIGNNLGIPFRNTTDGLTIHCF